MQTARGRREAAAFLAEGPHVVEAALDASFDIREVFVTELAAERDKDLLRSLAAAGVAVHQVSARALRAIGTTVTPQGIVAVVGVPSKPSAPMSPRLAVVLHECADPGNAGTVIRTADAAGADVVVLSDGSVDVWSSKCVRASAGSVFHLPVVAATSTAEAVAELRSRGCQVLATAAGGQVDLDELAAGDGLGAPTAWLFGSEAHGLPPDLLDAVDRVVRIPIHGRAESLNVAAAAAVCLYASARALRSG